MSEQIREQVSAFLDGELPGSETELLLKRLARDAVLRESFGRYALIGEAARGTRNTHLSRGFAGRVNLAIDGETLVTVAAVPSARPKYWWRPVAGSAVAAGVAVVAVLALQQRADTPSVAAIASRPTISATLPNTTMPMAATAAAKNHEAVSYTVPALLDAAARPLPPRRLSNYVFAHSQYSSLLGQRDVLTDLIVASDDEQAAANEPQPNSNAMAADSNVTP
jgi:sigma-E factor negative regulatory protein RseA